MMPTRLDPITTDCTTPDDTTEREAAAERAAEMQARIEALRHAAVDAITPTPALTAEVTPADPGAPLPPTDRVRLVAHTPSGALRLRLLPGAHEQVAEKTGIPWKYWQRMLEHAPELAVANVNHWLHAEPARRLVRMLNPITADDRAALARVGAHLNVRAVLSDAYRPLDHHSLLTTIIPEATAHGATVAEYHLDDRRFYVRFVTGGRDLRKLIRPGVHAFVEGPEYVRFGVSVKNSETGHAGIAVEPWVQVLRCLNGYMVSETLRVRHVGRRAEESDAWMAADTRRMDDAATFLKVRDRVREVFTEETARRAAQQIAEAAGVPIELPAEVPLMEFVGTVGRRLDLSDREVDILREEVVHELAVNPNRSGLTRWTLAQGITATARRIGANQGTASGDFDRQVELEQTGWTVLTDATAALVKAATNATRERGN